MTNFLKKKKTAFTLIELLVVIAIIGILSTLAVVAIQSARSKARDSKRIADVKQMQTALELYFNDNGSYPTSITSTIATAGVVYMTSVPSAPTPADGSCNNTTNAYTYASNGSTYTINFCLGSQVAGLSAGKKILTRDGIGSAPPDACGDATSITDPRDGKTYSIVAIGNQCWMSQNLNYDSGCSSNVWSDYYDTVWCGCHGNIASNCTTLGKLYQWSAAMAGSVTPGAQGVCPSGWHLPTDTEFFTLSTYLSGQSQYFCGGVSNNIDKALASVSGWRSSATACAPGNTPGANNSTGFNGIPGGSRNYDGVFRSIDLMLNLWTSTPSAANANYRYLHYGGAANFRMTISDQKISAYSVRCIKN